MPFLTQKDIVEVFENMKHLTGADNVTAAILTLCYCVPGADDIELGVRRGIMGEDADENADLRHSTQTVIPGEM